MSVSLWDRLRAAFAGRALYSQRIEALNDAIERFPTEPANYILRGELLLALNDHDAAANDFRLAIKLSAKQYERENWGVVAQILHDRALEGLRTAEKSAVMTMETGNTQGGELAVE